MRLPADGDGRTGIRSMVREKGATLHSWVNGVVSMSKKMMAVSSPPSGDQI